MTDEPATPDALVLGGGGILGEAWMSSLLAGLDEQPGFDSRQCGHYVGTSAGSIVAASLVVGVAPGGRLGRLPEPPPVTPASGFPAAPLERQARCLAAGLGTAAVAPLASLALTSTAHGGALVRRAALSRIPAGRRSLAALARELERIGASWDERLRIAVVDMASGRRVVLGAPGAPALPVTSAVKASCAIPGVFRPVRFKGRDYVDGGAWSPTNMDCAEVGQGDRVLCLNPTGGFRPSFGDPGSAIGPVSRMVAGAEALTLRRRGATVVTINPDELTLSVMGSNLMDPSRRSAVIAAGIAQGRRLAEQAAARMAA